jgi:hypothetical protein
VALTLAPRALSGTAQDLVKLLQLLGRYTGISYVVRQTTRLDAHLTAGVLKIVEICEQHMNNTNDAAMRLITLFHRSIDQACGCALS